MGNQNFVILITLSSIIYIFIIVTTFALNTESAEVPKYNCTKVGKFVDKSDPSRYHQCSMFQETLTYHHNQCPDKTCYNKTEKRCLKETCVSIQGVYVMEPPEPHYWKYLKAIGFNDTEIELMKNASPRVMTISKEGPKITLDTRVGSVPYKLTAELGQYVDDHLPNGMISKTIIKLNGNVLTVQRKFDNVTLTCVVKFTATGLEVATEANDHKTTFIMTRTNNTTTN